MKIKILNLFFDNDEKIDFNPEMIDWNDPTACVLCRRVDCICTIQKCPCDNHSDNCTWPDKKCICQNCLELIELCKCKIIIKKEE